MQKLLKKAKLFNIEHTVQKEETLSNPKHCQ